MCGQVKLDSTESYFLPNVSIFKLKSVNTNKILALFNFDVAEYANKMMKSGKKQMFMKDKLYSSI